MSHPSLQELTQAVHGLSPAPDHIDLCAECRETADRLRAERDLLRRADGRLPVPLPRRRFGSLMPLAMVAASLLIAGSLLIFRPSPSSPPAAPSAPPSAAPSKSPQEPFKVDKTITRFLEAGEKDSAQARELLAAAGPSILPALVQARHQRPASLRPDALAGLILELKRKAAGPAGEPLFRKLTASRVTMKQTPRKLSALAESFGAISGLTFHLDPQLFDWEIDFSASDSPLHQALDVIGILSRVDYDIRYGVVFLGEPHRLFDVENPPLLNGKKVFVPPQGHWRRQDLSPEAAVMLGRLDSLEMDGSFVETPQKEIIAFVRDGAQVPVLMTPEIDVAPITFKAKKQKASDLLEILTLPYGLDVRFEGGTILIYKRR